MNHAPPGGYYLGFHLRTAPLMDNSRGKGKAHGISAGI
jgi:hypothetical protein